MIFFFSIHVKFIFEKVNTCKLRLSQDSGQISQASAVFVMLFLPYILHVA